MRSRSAWRSRRHTRQRWLPRGGGALLHRAFAFALEGEDRAPGLLAEFLQTLEERVADVADRYRWDYIEALVICRKQGGTPQPTRPSSCQ